MTFRVYSAADAPLQSRPHLKSLQKRLGFVPNLAGIMAGAPQVLEGWACLEDCFQSSSLSPVERDVVLLEVSRRNDSQYCLNAHTCEAENHTLSPVDLYALRNGGTLNDMKLEALRRYAAGVMENHGRPPDAVKEAFLDAGYGPQQALEIVLCIALKTLTNYTYRLAHPPIDDAFAVTLRKKGHAA